MPSILDFHIRPRDRNNYSVEVFERDTSPPLGTSVLDFDFSYMTDFEIHRLDCSDQDPLLRLKRLEEFGARRYEKLFAPNVDKIWREYKEKSDFLILRLGIDPKARELERLPWETLFDGEEHIAAGVKTGLSRLPLDSQPIGELPPIPAPVKMYALISSPLDLNEKEGLAIEREQEILLQAVNSIAGQGSLQLYFEDEAKLSVIKDGLKKGYNIFHYTGHGVPSDQGGGLLLEDSEGERRSAFTEEALQVLRKSGNRIRLVVLSGAVTTRALCVEGFRDLACELMREKFPAVLSMQFSLTEEGGRLLAETLYPLLLKGRQPEIALSAARRALLHSDEPQIRADSFGPVLFLAHSHPLQTGAATTSLTPKQPTIDFSFHLPLPQLGFGFYGRRKEYRTIRDALLFQNHRVVIIHGIGGIGKTALAGYTATRLKDKFQGIYAFDCSSTGLAPESFLLEIHRYLEGRGVKVLEQLLHRSIPLDQLAGYLAQVLSQVPLLIILDNFETHLVPREGEHGVADENLRLFLSTLIKATGRGSRFLITSRFLFDIDSKRPGGILEVPLGALSRPEALGLMQKLPRLASASYEEKLRAFETFGGHPYALVALNRHCGHKPLGKVLEDASHVHVRLQEFLAIKLSCSNLSERAGKLLNGLAAFRKPVDPEAAYWVMGEKVPPSEYLLKKIEEETVQSEEKGTGNDELLGLFQKHIPEHHHEELADRYLDELIRWGLLTPLVEDGEAKALSAPGLVRDFCRDRQKEKEWNKALPARGRRLLHKPHQGISRRRESSHAGGIRQH